MTRPDFYDSVARELETNIPEIQAPRGGVQFTRGLQLKELGARANAIADQVTPVHTGPIAESVRDMRVVVVSRPGGIHRLLCRLGAHAWARRFEGTSYTTHSLVRRCAVCGVAR